MNSGEFEKCFPAPGEGLIQDKKRIESLVQLHQNIDPGVIQLLGELDLGLAQTHDIAHGVLQALLDKPWLYLDTSREGYAKYQNQWALLLENVDGITTQHYEFLASIWEAGASKLPEDGQCAVIAKFLNCSFTCVSISPVDGVLTTHGQLVASPNSEPEITMSATKFVDAYKTAELNSIFFLIFEHNENVQLIAKLDSIYPNKTKLGEYLLDVLNQLALLSNSVEARFNTKNVQEIITNTKIFEEINNQLIKLGQLKCFKEIWDVILPQSRDHFIINKLQEIEPSLSRKDNCELRINLIHQFTLELFFPVRKIILEEKERQEEIALESAERKSRLEKESKMLEDNIATESAQLVAIQGDLEEAKEKSLKNQEKLQEFQKKEAEGKAKLAKAQQKIQDLKERAAYTNFLQEIDNFNPANYANIREQLDKIHFRSIHFPELVRKVGQLFNVSVDCSYLEARILKVIPADHNELIQFLDGISQEPLFERDENGDLVVEGGHVIMSSVMPKIEAAIQSSRPAQVKIIGRENLILDEGFKKSTFHGMNIILIAKHVVAADAQISINVSGFDGKNHENVHAKDGVTEGSEGNDGLEGTRGENGGNVHIEALSSVLNVNNIVINCDGGNGGHGQNGGKGHKGRAGTKGADASCENTGWFSEYRTIKRGDKGEPGKPGGAGGLGGFGGVGGLGGKGAILSKTETQKEVVGSNGDNGKDGKRGAGGSQGDHGAHGKDHGWAARSHLYAWQELKGYSLYTTECKNIFGYLIGYLIHEGTEPPKAQNLSTATKLETQTRKNHTKQNSISVQSIALIKKSISSTEKSNDKARASAENQISTAESEMHHLNDSLQETQAETENLNNQFARMESLQRQETNLSASISASAKWKEGLMEASLVAAKSEQEATIAAKQLEQVAQNWKEAQDEALELSAKTQHSLVAETETETMVLNDGGHENEVDSSIQASSIERVSGQLVEFSRGSENKNFAAFTKLVVGKEPGVSDALESCFQDLEKQNISLNKQEFAMIENILKDNKLDENYLREELHKDIILGRRYSSQARTIFPSGTTLAQFFVSSRLRQSRVPVSSRNLPSELKAHLIKIELVSSLKAEVDSWISSSQPLDENAALNFRMPPSELPKEKRKILTEGLALFQGIQFHFPSSSSLSPTDFLRELRKHAEKENDPADRVGLIGFCKTREEFSANSLKVTLKIENADKMSEQDLAPLLDRAQFIISKSSLNLKELFDVSVIVLELENETKGKEGAKNLVQLMASKISAIYCTNTKEPLLASIKEKLNPDPKNLIRIIDQIVTLTESPFRNEPFEKRKKRYEEIAGKLKRKSTHEILYNIYKGEHGKYVDKSSKTLDFDQFIAFVANMSTEWDDHNAKKCTEYLKQILLQLESGKLVNGELVSFSKKELSKLESTLWVCLSPKNSTALEQIARQICQCPSIQLDHSAITAASSVTSSLKSRDSIIKIIREHIPHDSDESGITECKRIEKYIVFTLLRIEMLIIESPDCATKMRRVEDTILGMDMTELDKVVAAFEIFLDEFSKDFVHGNWEDYLTDLKQADHDTILDFRPLLRSVMLLIRWETPDKDTMLSEEDCEKIKEKLQNNVNPGVKDFKDFMDYLQTPKSKMYPLNALKHHMMEIEKRAMESWRKVEHLLRKGNSLLEQLISHSTPLYVTANFAHEVQHLVLTGLTGQNVDDKLQDLYVQFPDPPSIRERKVNKENAAQLSAKTEQFKLSLISGGFSFIKELDIFVQAYYPLPKQRPLPHFEILSNQLLTIHITGQENQWNSLTQKFKDKTSTSKMLSAQLACKVVNLEYSDPLREIILRILDNIMVQDPAFGKSSEVNKIILPKELTPGALFDALVPRFESKFICKFLLQAMETTYFDAICKLVEPEFPKRFRKMVCKLSPTSWKGWLERKYFNLTFFGITTQSKAHLDVRDSLAATVRVAAQVSPRGRKLLHAIQQTKVYSEFKMTYAFLEGESRLHWLKFLNSVVLRTISSGSKIFSTARDVKLFLKAARDIDFPSLEEILNHRFPQHWIKWILICSVQKDLGQMQQAEKLDNSNIQKSQDIELDVVPYLRVLLESPNFQRYRWVTLLHSLLRKELGLRGNGGRMQSAVVFEIIKIISETDFETNELRLLNNDCTLSPLEYWPRLIRISKMYKLGLSSEMTEKLLLMDENFSQKLVDSLVSKILGMNWTDDQQLEIIANFASSEWLLEDKLISSLQPKEDFNTAISIIENYSKDRRKDDLSLEDLLESASNSALNGWDTAKIARLTSLVQRIKTIFSAQYPVGKRTNPEQLIHKMTEFLKHWKQSYGNRSWDKNSPIDDIAVVDTVALIYRAVQWKFTEGIKDLVVTSRSPRDAQLVSLLLLIEGIGTGIGRLGEIQTGEGKSCIVAMFAAFCALFRARVHVITSNKVLAEADCSEYKGFYEILGLSAGNNCDKEALGDSARTKVYNNNVVYGELTGFQADILNTEFHSKKIMTQSADIVMVDEVDSLLLDKGANMLYLSHSIPELKYLRPIFLLIWDAVQQCQVTWDKKNPRPYTERHVQSVRKAVEVKLKNEDKKDELKVPVCLEEFINRRIGIWVKQAFVARFMPVNEDYIVDKNNAIVNMDKDTGVEQGNMQLSLGLHQFLQLKYKSRLAPESLKCVFMSNLEYFSMDQHKGKLFGITGTLGGKNETDLLSAHYAVKFFSTPRYKLNKRLEMEALIAKDEEEWLNTIQTAVFTLSPKQPILIITENLAEYHKILCCITQTTPDKPQLKVIEYKSSESDTKVTDDIKKNGGLKSGEVIVSTNLGGRGTDICIGEKQELYVILTYLPPNIRVERQAFGRTARAGQNGTVQFILKCAGNQSLYKLKEYRTQKDVRRIQIIKERDIPKIRMEDSLFKDYMTFYKSVQAHESFLRHRKRLRTLQLTFLNNRWAVWLDSMRHRLNSLHLQGAGVDRIRKEFESFKRDQFKKLESDDVQIFAEFTSEQIKLGLLYERLALKTLLNTAMKSEFDEMENVAGELWENVCSATTTAWDVICTTFSDPKKVISKLEEISQKLGKSAPPDLDVGLQILKAVTKNDPNFCEAAFAYGGSMTLQKDPSAKVDAKESLKAAKDAIISRLALNRSSVEWLNAAAVKTVENGEGANLSQNTFELQINRENNLLQIHIDAINGALGTGITPQFIKHQIKLIDTIEEGERLLEVLLKPEFNLLKGSRFSGTFLKELSEGEGIQVLSERLGASVLPCLLSELLQFINDNSECHHIEESYFKWLIITRDKFLKHLCDKGLTEDVTKYIITFNGIKKNVKSPGDFQKFEPLISPRLYKNQNKILSQEILFPNDADGVAQAISLDMNRIEEVLQSLGWVKSKSLPLKIKIPFTQQIKKCTERQKEVQEGCSCELPTVQELHSSEIYKVFEALANSRSVPLWTVRIKEGVRTLEHAHIPFPLTEEEGAEEIFKVLLLKGIVKRPKVSFPKLADSKLDASARIQEIEQMCNSEDFKKQLILWDPKLKTNSEDLVSLKKDIISLLKNCIGTLKRHPEVRVNYESIATRTHLENGQRSDELQELLSEGIFDRLIVFDEYIRWYQNKSCFILVVGVAEIAAGVAVEILSGGLLSPLAAFLISEGSSDLLYSMKNLYNGDQLEWSQYEEHKVSSLKRSAAAGLLGAVGFALGLGTRLLLEFSLVGAKTALCVFVEGNIEQGIKNNVFGIATVLDQSLSGENVQTELAKFDENATTLWLTSWEPTQAQDIITKIVNTTLTQDADRASAFNLELEKAYSKIKSNMYGGMFLTCVQGVLPNKIHSAMGVSGTSGNCLAKCAGDISSLIAVALQLLNRQVERKVAKLVELRQGLYIPEENRPSSEVFKEILTQINANIKHRLRLRIASHIFIQITGQKLRAAMHETIRSGYETLISHQSLVSKVFELPEEDPKESDSTFVYKRESGARELEYIVMNAGGRTVEEVRNLWPGPQEELEILGDSYGNHFVTIRNDESLKYEFVISTTPTAFDEFIDWKQAQDLQIGPSVLLQANDA